MALQSALGLLLCVASCVMAFHADDASVERRAPAMGFMGMRGKKDDGIYDDKRAPTMGFAAMRGKKDSLIDISDVYPEYKRGGTMGFMGMRGKKFDYTNEDFMDDDDLWPMDDFDKRAPSAGFMGTRGKKMPQNSAFFGMRGKKGPSGFVGMRGKKGPASGFMGVRGKKNSSQDLDSLLALLGERGPQSGSIQYTGDNDLEAVGPDSQ